MYKDKDKQREANRERQRRYKAKHKGVTSEGVTDKALPDGTMTIETLAMMDAGCGDKLDHGLKRGKDIKCITIGDQVRSMKAMAMLHSVTGKPGDADYNGICTPEWIKERKGVAS